MPTAKDEHRCPACWGEHLPPLRMPALLELVGIVRAQELSRRDLVAGTDDRNLCCPTCRRLCAEPENPDFIPNLPGSSASLVNLTHVIRRVVEWFRSREPLVFCVLTTEQAKACQEIILEKSIDKQ